MPYRRKILIIEGEIDEWDFIQRAVETNMPGVNAIFVSSPNEALEHLQTLSRSELELPNLILMNLYLPTREDGLQLLKALKKSGLYRSIPVVLFCNSELAEDIFNAYQFGCSSYLTKPVNSAEWVTYFSVLHRYWWQTVTLPRN